MDKFIRSVKSHIIPLNTLDMVASVGNIPAYFYFENCKCSLPNSKCNEGSLNNTFMPSSLLYTSFYTALIEFPILAGHFVQNTNNASGAVVVDKNNLNLPEFIESHSNIHFKALKAAKYSWSALPRGAATVGASLSANKDGVIKLLNLHIIRMKYDSGLVLFASIPHCIVDAVGYGAFIWRWAEICKQMHHGTATSKINSTFVYDRCYLEHTLPKYGKKLDSVTSRLYTSGGFLSRLISRLPPLSRTKMYLWFFSLIKLAGNVFFISQEALDNIRLEILDLDRTSISQKAEQQLSDNDIITALVSMVVAQGIKSSLENTPSKRTFRRVIDWFMPWILGKQSEFSTMFVVDPRPRLQHESKSKPKSNRYCYTGNMAYVRIVNSPLELVHADLNSNALGHVARSIRTAVNECDAYFAKELVNTINKKPLEFANGVLSAATNMQRVVVSNHSRFPLYEIDFGSGTPVWICPPETFHDKTVFILPLNPRSKKKGYNIYISAEKRVISKILDNKAWARLADLVY
ncbi:hypothetical protein BX070DRAFT_230437 [Coemansia spiralis]|nr:hypothetical protein BX070DRAFT_230437 [Coemansia spiralis]